jgi:hypothetical protein
MSVKSGGCLCGGVTYEIRGKLRPIVACHCNQCRKTSGHYVAATQAHRDNVTIRSQTLKWFQSSQTAERGFCGTCGSNLFWRRFDTDLISIWAGTIDGPTGLRIESQLYPECAGDYYDLPDVPTIDQTKLA